MFGGQHTRGHNDESIVVCHHSCLPRQPDCRYVLGVKCFAIVRTRVIISKLVHLKESSLMRCRQWLYSLENKTKAQASSESGSQFSFLTLPPFFSLYTHLTLRSTLPHHSSLLKSHKLFPSTTKQCLRSATPPRHPARALELVAPFSFRPPRRSFLAFPTMSRGQLRRRSRASDQLQARFSWSSSRLSTMVC